MRCAGYSVLALICSQLGSAKMVVDQWKDFHIAGLCGTAVDIAMDNNECSLVKEQVINFIKRVHVLLVIYVLHVYITL